MYIRLKWTLAWNGRYIEIDVRLKWTLDWNVVTDKEKYTKLRLLFETDWRNLKQWVFNMGKEGTLGGKQFALMAKRALVITSLFNKKSEWKIKVHEFWKVGYIIYYVRPLSCRDKSISNKVWIALSLPGFYNTLTFLTFHAKIVKLC